MLQELMDKHAAYLLKISYLYVKDRHVAEDIVQDVFIKIYEKYRYELPVNNERAFLVKMTINKCKDYLKSWHAKKMKVSEMIGLDRSSTQKDSLIRQEEQAMVGQAVMNLPMKYRELIILFYFDEQTLPQITETLNLPLGTVKTRLIKARKLLKASLKSDQWEVLLNEA